MTHSMTLHFAPGACSRVPLIALETIGQNFDTELVIFMKGGHKTPEFKKLNPSSKIPVLVVDGVPISQNIAILNWLNNAFPEKELLPKANTAIEKAQTLSLLARFPSDLHPLVSRIRLPQFFCDTENGPDRVKAMAMTAMKSQLAPIEDTLSHQSWIAGAQWSIIDAYLHWVWFRIKGAGFDTSDFPKITAHYLKTLDMPAVQRAIEKENKAQDFLDSKGLSPNFSKIKLGDTQTTPELHQISRRA